MEIVLQNSLLKRLNNAPDNALIQVGHPDLEAITHKLGLNVILCIAYAI